VTPVVGALRKLSAFLHAAAMTAACITLGIMLGSMMLQVVARYVFASPPAWTEELCRFCMVWAGLLGATTSYYMKFDPAVGGYPATAPRRVRISAHLLCAVTALAFVLPILYFSFFDLNGDFARGYLGRNINKSADTIPISMFWVALAIPISFAIITVHVLAARMRGQRETEEILL